jgi:hypothetical protein
MGVKRVFTEAFSSPLAASRNRERPENGDRSDKFAAVGTERVLLCAVRRPAALVAEHQQSKWCCRKQRFKLANSTEANQPTKCTCNSGSSLQQGGCRAALVRSADLAVGQRDDSPQLARADATSG